MNPTPTTDNSTPASAPADAPTGKIVVERYIVEESGEMRIEPGSAPTDAPGEAGEIAARVLKLDARATKGPWETIAGGTTHGLRRVGTLWDRVAGCDVDKQSGNASEHYDGGIWKHEDAELIAFYRTACPQLARTIATLRAECEGLRAEIAEMKAAILLVKPMTELGIKMFNRTEGK